MMKPETRHNPYFDFLRGVAIIMVVGIHTCPEDLTMSDGISEFIQIVFRNTLNCAVPLFLAISGYFIARKKLDTIGDCRVFWRKQIPTVYIPCLVFSIPWFALYCVSVDYKSGG